MKTTTSAAPAFTILGSVLLTLIAGCAQKPDAASPKDLASFQRVRPLLETNCVHCHGQQRLPTMPAIADTKALAALIGPGKLIVPGAPESSRFFQVVTLTDNQAGAMPPTGHGIARAQVETLRAWIQSGASLPPQNLALQPRGPGPRSL